MVPFLAHGVFLDGGFLWWGWSALGSEEERLGRIGVLWIFDVMEKELE